MNFPITLPVKIVMLGAGGTGGYVAPHLYRLAYLSQRPIQILICDGDTVEEKNLFRQNFVDIDVGQNKAAVLARRYAAALWDGGGVYAAVRGIRVPAPKAAGA